MPLHGHLSKSASPLESRDCRVYLYPNAFCSLGLTRQEAEMLVQHVGLSTSVWPDYVYVIAHAKKVAGQRSE